MHNPKTIAITKLIIVPIKIYSASSLLFLEVSSPNRKIDFAAIKNPIASNWSNNTNIKIKIRSRHPIHKPAFSRPENFFFSIVLSFY